MLIIHYAQHHKSATSRWDWPVIGSPLKFNHAAVRCDMVACKSTSDAATHMITAASPRKPFTPRSSSCRVPPTAADGSLPSAHITHDAPMHHTPQTNRGCAYPQHLVLQLDQPHQLSQIQLLSHEHKVRCVFECHIVMYHTCPIRFQAGWRWWSACLPPLASRGNVWATSPLTATSAATGRPGS